MMIEEKDCDVEPLEMDDLESKVDRVQAFCLLEHIKLAKLGLLPITLLLARCSPANSSTTKHNRNLRVLLRRSPPPQ